MKTNTLILAIIMSSCGDRMSKTLSDEISLEAMDSEIIAPALALAIPPSKESLNIPLERTLIKNGTLSFETNDIETTKIEIGKLCQELNAYTASENQHNYQERLQNNQEIRVPAHNFDQFILKLESLGRKIENKNISTQDVTEEFIDVQARLKTKKELEIRYRELLKLAKTVNEMISIESEMGEVRSDIESMEGRLNYLKDQVAFSTLKVSYYQTIATDFGFASKFIQSFKNGWNNLILFLIGIINVWPFLILASISIVVALRWRKKTFRIGEHNS